MIIKRKVMFSGVPEGKKSEKNPVNPVRKIPEIFIIIKTINE
jgi:hypothetical protein